jgi:integrase
VKDPRGWSVFWRESKRRWVLSRLVAGKWEQKILVGAGRENTKKAEAGAITAAQRFMAESGERPAAGAGLLVWSAVEKWLLLAEARQRDGLIAPATLKDYRIDAKVYLLPHFGALPLRAIDVPGARAWLRQIRGEKSASTVRGARSSAAVFFDCAVAEGWVRGENPFDNRALLDELPALPVTGAPQIVPLAWVQKLLDDETIPLAWRARYALAATSGARDGEIHGARFCDLELGEEPPDDAGLVKISAWRIEQATAIVGREGFATANATKTRGSVRTLPLHQAAAAALRAWLSTGWASWTGRAARPLDYLFPGEDGEPSRPRSAENLRADLVHVGLADQIGGKPVEFKSLRATFATALDEAGVDENVRRRLLGHGGRTVTERHYTRRELAQLSAAVSTIPIVWRSQRSQLVTAVTTESEIPMFVAIPGRVELPTNGLGSRRDDLPGCDHGAHRSEDRRVEGIPLRGCDIASGRDVVAAGHNGLAGLVTGAVRLAAESSWWDASDALVLDGAGEADAVDAGATS